MNTPSFRALCGLCALAVSSAVIFTAARADQVTLSGSAPYPLADVRSIDYSAGVITFAWLDTDGHPVDSGGSIAHFTPSAPGEDGTIPALSSAEIAAAIIAPEVIPVPAAVTPYQLWRALKATTGITRTQVLDAVGALSDADLRDTLLTAIETPRVYERADPNIAALGAMLGLTTTQVDDVFRAAAAL